MWRAFAVLAGIVSGYAVLIGVFDAPGRTPLSLGIGLVGSALSAAVVGSYIDSRGKPRR